MRVYAILGERLLPGNIMNDILQFRLEKCIDIYSSGDIIIVCGGNVCGPPDCTHTEAHIMNEYLIKRCIPAGCIIRENGSHDTVYNIRNLGIICLANLIHKVYIISSDWHLPRVRRICELYFPKKIRVRYIPSIDCHYHQRITKEREYVKRIMHRVGYQI
jgi:uncharacterized SAM-binding protein YcdF (DUF218 family)